MGRTRGPALCRRGIGRVAPALLPALLAATAFGVDQVGRFRTGRLLTGAALAILTVLSFAHTLRIVAALASGATG